MQYPNSNIDAQSQKRKGKQKNEKSSYGTPALAVTV
jgi:hypothetical protein